jgi:hypothetical protein
MLLALKAVDPLYPIASYFGDLGHPRASNKPAEFDYVLALIREWLAYYLRGVGSEPAHAIRAAITRPRDQPFSPLDVITVADDVHSRPGPSPGNSPEAWRSSTRSATHTRDSTGTHWSSRRRAN